MPMLFWLTVVLSFARADLDLPPTSGSLRTRGAALDWSRLRIVAEWDCQYWQSAVIPIAGPGRWVSCGEGSVEAIPTANSRDEARFVLPAIRHDFSRLTKDEVYDIHVSIVRDLVSDYPNAPGGLDHRYPLVESWSIRPGRRAAELSSFLRAKLAGLEVLSFQRAPVAFRHPDGSDAAPFLVREYGKRWDGYLWFWAKFPSFGHYVVTGTKQQITVARDTEFAEKLIPATIGATDPKPIRDFYLPPHWLVRFAEDVASAPVIEVIQESKYFAYSYGTPIGQNHFFPIAEKATQLDTRTYEGRYPEELLKVTVPTTIPR